MRTEVTKAQYAQCVAAGICMGSDAIDPEFADLPVTGISLAAARVYAAWVGGQIPDDAQWQRACRGDDDRIYPWGDAPLDASRANAGQYTGSTTLVGSYPAGASPYGVLDMIGNVHEWVLPRPAADGSDRLIQIVRGGSYIDSLERDPSLPPSDHVPLSCDSWFEFSSPDPSGNGFRVVSPEAAATLPVAAPSEIVATDQTGAEYVTVPAGNGVAAFRIMRTEVTIAQYAECVAAGACRPTPGSDAYENGYYDEYSYVNRPVALVDFAQATSYAAWVGGQLPTEAQWLRACEGDDRRLWPWGDAVPDSTRANRFDPTKGPAPTDGFWDGVTPVGIFPAGASPYGVLDMAGNVAEWVQVDWGGTMGHDVLGGSFASLPEGVVCRAEQFPFGVEQETQLPSLGFRVVALDAAALPAPVMASAGEPEWLSIPAGNGVAAFRILRTEVTNAQYAQCVAAGVCTVPYRDDFCDAYPDPAYADHPVVCVDRAQARTYAAWIGGSLPSEAQWFRACQGDDGRTWPWGNIPPDGALANFNWEGRTQYDTTPVGSLPAGASPYGAMDMAGNVWEWVEADDGTTGRYIVRGGAFLSFASDSVMCDARSEDGVDGGFNNLGFRVVASER